MSELIPSTCLAVATLIGEAGGEPHEGKVGVAIVLRNRMKLRYASDGTVAGTVLRSKQFSMYNDDHPDTQLFVRVCQTDDLSPVAAACFQAWHESGNEAARAQFWQDFERVVLYHTEAVKPEWANKATFVRKIGRHLFYEDRT